MDINAQRSMQVPNLSLPPLVQNSPDLNVLAAAVIDWRTLSARHFSMPQHRKILPAWGRGLGMLKQSWACAYGKQIYQHKQSIQTIQLKDCIYILVHTLVWHIPSWRSETGAQLKKHNMDKNRSNIATKTIARKATFWEQSLQIKFCNNTNARKKKSAKSNAHHHGRCLQRCENCEPEGLQTKRWQK